MNKIFFLIFIFGAVNLLSSENAKEEQVDTNSVKIPEKSYYFDKYETTVKEFEECVKAEKCSKENFFEYDENHKLCNFGNSEKQNHPMNCINLAGAKEYCSFKGKRVPKESEWEYVAKSNENYKYSGSKDINSVACWNKKDGTCQIGTKKANKFGIYDLSGNVIEWTIDCYSSNCKYNAIRGGAWNSDNENLLEVTFRYYSNPATKLNNGLGFRCIKDK